MKQYAGEVKLFFLFYFYFQLLLNVVAELGNVYICHVLKLIIFP